MPQKDASYHRAAIQYNEGLAASASALAEELENDEVQRWCRSVSKQHKFHAGRHKKALEKMENQMNDAAAPLPAEPTEAAPDPSQADVPTPVGPDPEQAAEPTEEGVGTDDDQLALDVESGAEVNA